MLSCSSDGSVILWNAETAEVVETYSWHTDYVKSLAVSPILTHAASTGLDAQAAFWDTEVRSLDRNLTGQKSTSDTPIRTYALDASGYSLAMSTDGNLLACGTTGKHIPMFDTRMTKKLHKLKGHEDNVKALVFNTEGTLLISGILLKLFSDSQGGSDRSLKLWDLRNPSKCLKTFNVHADSIWSVWIDPDQFRTLYSASRDGVVRQTNLDTEKFDDLM